MCKTLYRFEDKYGMHTIVSSLKNFEKDTSLDMYTFKDIYVQYGLSCVPCLCTADVADLCHTLGIGKVVMVFDLDGPMGGMLTYDDIYRRHTAIDGVEILYYPVVWCAETLIHYQLCPDITDAEIYPVPKRVRTLLNSLINTDVKKTETILVPNILRNRLLELDLSQLLDKRIIEFLLGISDRAFTLPELESLMRLAADKFQTNYGWWRK